MKDTYLIQQHKRKQRRQNIAAMAAQGIIMTVFVYGILHLNGGGL